METKKALETALRDAMRSKNDTVLRTIRLVMSSIKMSEIEKGNPLDEAAVISIIQKEIKSRKESIADAEKAGRSDLMVLSNSEIAILENFLPKQMPEDELVALVTAAIQEAHAVSPSDMGKVMKLVMPKVQGRVAGDVLSQTVRKLLVG
jgi:uncharacterized protein